MIHSGRLQPAPVVPDEERHEPTLYWTRRYGCWATCWCGWTSELWTTTVGAHLAFGRHLIGQDR